MKTTIPVVTASALASDNHHFLPSAMKQGKIARFIKALATGIGLLVFAATAHAQFVHPGCLSTQADLDRMKAKVDTGAQPWKGGYDRLLAAPYCNLNYDADPRPIVYVDSSAGQNNYIVLARDAAAAYQLALRYHVSGEEAYGAKAVSILMEWANTHYMWSGNTNVSLRAGLYGYQLACAGELMRNYSGWAPADFAKFQNYVRTQFYNIVSASDPPRGFLNHHHGTCWSHYWANWEMAAMATVIATGVLCDDQAIFQEAIDYFYNGVGVGRISELLHYVHPNGLGQSQEFGRDQGHASMLVPLLGTFCEIAWNQGVDLYSELDNALLSMSENLSKHNLFYDVPYVTYINCDYVVQTNIGSGQGFVRAGADLIYNHYVNRRGLSAPYSKEAAEQMRPDGGGGQYGTNSGGFDQLGFTTLTHSLDPIAAGVAPSQLRPVVKGGKITLSWRGSAKAKSYNVKRATTSGGPYINVATVGAKNTYFMDVGVPAGTTCYYVVSANNPEGESAHSAEISAMHDGQLHGAVIGTDGSWANAGAGKGNAFDGSLRNSFDAPTASAWVGLDLGEGVSAVVTGVKFCPNRGQSWRLVGGKFQGSNTADFSSGVVDLFTIPTEPPSEVLTTQSISNANSFRYVRYLGNPSAYCNMAEMQIIGNVTGMTPPAAAPTGLAVSSPWFGEATLNWNSVAGATDFVIKRSLTSGGPYTVVEYSGFWDTNYTDRKLAAGYYYYVVSALNSVGETVNSAEQGVQVLANVAPGSTTSAHSGSGGGNEGSDKVADWNTNTKWFSGANTSSSGWLQVDLGAGNGQIVTRYDLTSANDVPNRDPKNWQLQGSNDAVNWTTLDSRTDETFASRFLTKQYTFTNSTAYRYYKLNILSNLSGSAVDGIQLAEWALISQGVEPPSSVPDTTPPATPAGLMATGGDGIVALDWADNTEPDIARYTVYRSTTNGGPYDAIATGVTFSAYSDTTVTNGTTYYYVVTATDTSLNESVNSAQASGTPQLPPPPNTPTGLAATAVSSNRIDLAWNAVNGAYSYTLMRSTTSGGPYTTLATGVLPTNFSDTSVSPRITYYYVVMGVNSGGQSANSNEASVRIDDLHLHLKFDETSGTTAADSSGNGRNATLVNGPVFAPGKIDNSLVFASASSRYATLPAGVVSALNDFTISTWVKPTSHSNWARVFDFGSGTATNMFFAPQNGANGKPRFAIKISNSAEQLIDGAEPLAAGVWTHVAVTLSGSTGTLYLNGVAVGTNNAMSFRPSGMGNTNLNYLGKSQYPDPYFNGALDDFRIYSSALNASEIGILAAGQLTAPQNVAAAPGDSQIALTWDAVSGAENYSVKRATTTGGPYTTVQTDLISTSFTDTGLTNGTTYYYVVSASNLGGESPNSAETSATPLAPPAVPEGLAAIADDATVALAWSAASGADSYQVKRATAPGGPYTTLASGVTGLTYTDNAVTNGTTYYYVISGVNPVAESANSAEVSALPLPPVPAAPATLTATPGNSTVALAWSAAEGADSYNVKRATNSGGPYATLASGLTSTSYNDTSAVNETTYYYLVTATNLGGESESSPEVSATPVTPPVAPAGLAATSGDASASLAWNSVAGASGYRLKRATTSGGPYALVTESTGTSFADTGLTNGTTYYYVLSAYNAGGESANSSPVSAEPQAVPDAPTGLAATAASSSKINLAWNTVSGANSYAVKRATTTGGPYTTLATGLTATSFNDTGLTSATTYYYVVTATSNGGESATSTEASATTSDLRVSLAFDETSGTTATDSAGDGYHATLVNGPLFAPGTLGNAVELDGTNDHLTLPSGVIGGLTNFSISVWVKPDTITDWARVFDFGTGTGVYMFLAPRNPANGKVRFAITTGGWAGEQKIDGQAALTAGAWSHVVITGSGNTGILYVNGVEVGRNSAMTLNPSSLGTTNLNYLGRSQYPDPYFDGRIDDFRLYTRALGAAEISAATAAQMPLASVNGLQTTAASSGQINLSWTANPNATSYNVKRATTPGGPYTTLATGVTATNYSSGGLSAGATYYYVVSATNAGGEGANSAETGATTFPAAPATLTATAVSSTQLNLTWGASNGATSYTVKRSATSGGAYTTLATGVTATSYSDTGLAAGATWYYVVSASNTGESVDSTEASATTFAETPSGLAATVVSSSAIDLSWNATAGATGYDVKRSTSAGGPFDTISSGVTATAFSDSGLNAATTYHYVVAATNAAGASPDSASVNATTLPLPPATPSGLAATPGIAQVSLTWSASPGATGYTVKRATVSGGSYTVVASDLASPSYTDTGLTNGTTYYYVVNAANTGGTSADSGEVSAAPSGLPSPWVTADIGTTGLAGSAEFASDAYTVNGAGSLGGTTDGFRYLYQPLSADGSIIARISTLEDTGSSARIGIMIRDTLATNSRMAALSVTGSGAYKWMRRTTTGGNVSNTNSSSGTAPNIWVRLVRVGNTITASKSTNGTSWTTIGSTTVTMASSCYIGLAVSSGSTTTLNTSVFDNVTATP
jgi:fibronectin type 3 domain-containing protein